MSSPTSLLSTLFPYTTLFRSDVGERAHHALHLLGALDAQRLRSSRQPTAFAVGQVDADDHVELPDGERDRKSTRLNSSHLGNSYAVFCLKKKISNKNSTSCQI